MPEIQVLKDPEAQPGDHVLVLDSVELIITKNPFAKKEDGSPDEEAERERLIWKFISDQTNEFGEPYVHKVWTGPNYGSPRADLTGFLDMLIPDMTEEKARHFRTDSLIGRAYQAKLKRVKTGKNGEKTVIKIAYIEPADAMLQAAIDASRSAAAQAAQAAEDETPF